MLSCETSNKRKQIEQIKSVILIGFYKANEGINMI